MSSPSILSKNIEDKSSTTEIAPPPTQPQPQPVTTTTTTTRRSKHLLDVLHVDHER